MNSKKIAILLSHPIQYFSPLLKLLNKDTSVKLIVYYCFNPQKENATDTQFGKKIKWDIPLLEGYEYKFLKNYSLRPSAGMKFWGLINPGIFKELRKEKPDVILVHGWGYFSNLYAIFSAKILRIKIWLRTESPLNQELLKSKVKLKIRKMFFKFIFARIDKFLYIGKQNKLFYEYYGVKSSQLFFTPYAVDNDYYQDLYKKNISKKQEIRNELKITENAKVILFTGKYINKKRPLDLLKSYKNLNFDNKFLIMVGEGELRPEMEKYTDNNKLKNVIFTGFINTSQIYKYYIAADIFVLPSQIGETWGLVVNEALNFGLPVVVSNLPGSAYDLVKENENGFIYNTGNIEELTLKIETILSNEQKRTEFGKISKEIIKNYSYQNIIQGIISALKN